MNTTSTAAISPASPVSAVAILAGGESRRMGADKASLALDGESLLARQVRIALSTSLPVLVVGRERPEDWDAVAAVRFLPDRVPGLGPIGGIRSALEASAGSGGDGGVLAIACDMPRLDTTALRWLVDAAAHSDAADGIAVRNDGRIEPLFAVYRPACLPRLDAWMAEGRRSLQALIAGDGGFQLVDAPSEIATALTNINTPEEWERLLQERKP